MYMPVSGETIAVWPLILIGFTVGVCGGFFGVGGAFMVTPALNIFGFPMVYAIGTDMCHMIGKSIVSTFRHWKLGHVEVKLALVMVIGTMLGVEGGAQTVMWLSRRNLAGPAIRYVYMLILFGVGSYILYEVWQARKKAREQGTVIKDVVGNRVTAFIQRTRIAPMVELQRSRLRISVWWIILVGLLTGYLSGLLGVGGGFIRVPALLYILGLPMKLAVGTDLFEIIISSSYGGFTYALKGVVELYAAIIMLIGAAVGAQIGCVATRYVHGLQIRFYFAICIFGSALGVAAKQVSTFYRDRWRAAITAVLDAQGRSAAEIAGFIKDKAAVKAMLAGNPQWQELARRENVWTVVAGVLSLGLAVVLSALIISLCVRGMIQEKKTGKVAGA